MKPKNGRFTRGERAFFEKTVFGERVAGDSFFGMKIKNGWFVWGGPVGCAHGGVGRGVFVCLSSDAEFFLGLIHF